MKKVVIFRILLFFTVFQYGNAQVKYEKFQSDKLDAEREIKIQLPRGYADDVEKHYPVFLVLDGDYLFESVAGNVDYFSYWEDMPGAIVVGINQLNNRYDDCLYSEQNSLPIDTGVSFFEFISTELLPYIDKTYRTTAFKIAVGHGETANFINYYLLKANPLFGAYVAISPDLAPNMLEYIPERIEKLETKIFYYLAHAATDNKSIKGMTTSLNTDLKVLENENLYYSFNSFEDTSHYSVPAHAIPRALQHIFKIYQPISKQEYKDEILNLEISPVVYLEEKYQAIEHLFGIKKKILINDFKAIEAAIKKQEMFEYYEPLGKLAREHYPKTMLGNYYLGRFYEEMGEPKKALRTYQNAYMLEEIAGVTKDKVLELAEALKEDFGFR